MQHFEYMAPGTIKEAIAALQGKGEATVLAGGTDILLGMKDRVRTPEVVVDIKRIPGFGELRFDPRTGLLIGPAVTMRQIERSSLVRRHYPAIAQGAEVVGSVQIRNRATLVGNTCNAAPSADTAPGLLVLGARVRIAGPRGRRSLLLENFFTGPGQTALRPGELVTGIQVPPPAPRTGSAYMRHTTRGAMDLAAAGVAVALTLAPRTGVCQDVRIALGAVAPTPRRARKAEQVLQDQSITPALIAAAAAAALEEAQPISDVRASAAYRRELTRVLTGRMVAAALEDARRHSRARGRRGT